MDKPPENDTGQSSWFGSFPIQGKDYLYHSYYEHSEQEVNMSRMVRIGTGAGYAGDRIEPAVELAEKGKLGYLVFECLAERTIALAQKHKLEDPEKGYDPLLEKRMRQVLPFSADNGIKIITNMGAANITAAGEIQRGILEEMGLPHLKVGLVSGDDILDDLFASDFMQFKALEQIPRIKHHMISANAYLGARPILDVLQKGADIVITGRTCDASLFLAPMMHELGWKEDDWEKLGRGTAIAHLLECSAQVTGGYFADPGYKDVEGLANVGFPIAEIDENGEAVITKLPGTGGEVSPRTVKEQLLYEVHDPQSYITADVVANFTTIRLKEIEKDRVKVVGGGGKPRPERLKVTLGFRNGFIGEAQISYAGEGAQKRAQLAARIIMERLRMIGLEFENLRFDFMCAGSLWLQGSVSSIPNEIRLRVIGRAYHIEKVEQLCNEVEALYVNGPAGGGGVTRRVDENIAVTSDFIPRENVTTHTRIMGGMNG